MSTNTNKITDMSPNEWAALKSVSSMQHGTVYSGDHAGTATTQTPGVGKTVVAYKYDAAKQTAEFTINEKPAAVPAEVIWFGLGGTVAYVSGTASKTF
jgi:hypothetical protein